MQNRFIISKNEKEILELSIYDMAGSKVFEKQVQTTKNVYVLELPLANGVYLIKIKNQLNETVSKKLVINK